MHGEHGGQPQHYRALRVPVGAPSDSIQCIRIEFLPGFNTDPAGVYIVSDPRLAITEQAHVPAYRVVGGMVDRRGLPSNAPIILLDQLGRCVYRETSTGGTFQLNMSLWPAGVYLARIAQGTGSTAIRLLKLAE